jgi:streptomycin 6-kinase
MRWLAGLDDVVDYLESAWCLQVGEVLSGGSEGLVVGVVREGSTDAVLKIGLTGSADLEMEAHVYKLAQGSGYAELLEFDKVHNSLLLEKLGLPLAEEGLSSGAQIKLICLTLQDAWKPLASPDGIMTGAEKARWLCNFIGNKWQELDQPCSQQTIEQAQVFARQREDAHSADNAVLVHGDAHSFNTLSVMNHGESNHGLYKFVDPDGLFAERACDLAVPMRGWNRELLAGNTFTLARERCELLSELTDVDDSAIWQWGFIERVSTGLVLNELGQEEESSAFLEVADRLCAG